MQRNLLFKTLFLAAVLITAIVVIITLTHNASSADPTASQQTFLEQFIVAGGPIVWFILLPMSLIMVSLAAQNCLAIRRKKLLPPAIGPEIAETILKNKARQPQAQDDLVSTAVANALKKGAGDWFRTRSTLTESLQDQTLRLLRKIEWLNLIGNVSPMVGLFGTVFGMIKLFNAIVIAGGQPQPAQLAEGISVALVTTFWGLFIAIPALAIYGVLRNRIETLVNDAVTEAENLIPQIRLALKSCKQFESQIHKPTQPIQPLDQNHKRKTSKSTLNSISQDIPK